MDTNSTSRFHEIFDEAFSIEDPVERDFFLTQKCGNDQKLKKSIADLFDALSEASSFLDPNFQLQINSHKSVLLGHEDDHHRPNADDIPIGVGEQVGSYVLTKELGIGGFGAVYLADQLKPIKRQVAVKFVKHGQSSSQVVARFNVERQALAMMNHDGIARIFDAGSAGQGQPYFVMEYVEGSSITEYCDKNQLNIDDRLRLIGKVCDAVHYAHQKGLLHRDIKPGNILVTNGTEGPQPKLIDFGIAKSLEVPVVENGIDSSDWHFMGTPRYMSPEHATFGPKDLDVRSDVFSLGVVTYELLTGVTPITAEKVRGSSLEDVFRMIREETVGLLSRSLLETRSNDSQTVQQIASNRSTDSKSLVRRLADDLDWVVLKALQPERSNRYESALEFKQDIVRFLNKEPVEARPPTNTYKIRKFVQKHLVAVLAGGAFVAILLAATIFSLWQANKANNAYLAVLEQKQAFQDLFAIMSSVLESPAPEDQGEKLKLVDLLRNKTNEIKNSFPNKPEVRMLILSKLGATFTKLGMYQDAEELLQLALEVAQENQLTLERSALDALFYSAKSNYKTSQFDPAIAQIRQLLDRERQAGADPQYLVRAMNLDGLVTCQNGDNDKAKQILTEALEIAKSKLGEHHQQTLFVRSSLAVVEDRYRNLQGSLKIREELFETLSTLDNPNAVLMLELSKGLTTSYLFTKEFSKALPYSRSSSETLAKIFGPQSSEFLENESLTAMCEAGIGNIDDAIERLDSAIATQRKFQPNDEYIEIELQNAIAVSYMLAAMQSAGHIKERPEDKPLKKGGEAEKLYQLSASKYKSVLDFVTNSKNYGEKSNFASSLRSNLCQVFRALNRYDEILKILKHEHDLSIGNEKITPSSHFLNASEIARANFQLGRLDESLKWIEKSFEVLDTNWKHNEQLHQNMNIWLLSRMISNESKLKANDTRKYLERIESRISRSLKHEDTPEPYQAKLIEKQIELYEAWVKPKKLNEAKQRLKKIIEKQKPDSSGQIQNM